MPLHKSRFPDNDGGTDPVAPPSTPVSDSEMTFDSVRTPHLSVEAKNLLDYLRNGPDFEASPISLVVYYYLPGETDSSDSSPPSPVPPRSPEQRGAGPSRSSGPTRSTGRQQDRGTPPPRDGRSANDRTKDKPPCKACPIHCPPPNENNIDDGTLRTTGFREYLRSLLGTRPTTTSQDSPSSAQRSTRLNASGPSRTSGSRQRRLKHRRRPEMDEWEFSFLDPEYDSESDTTPTAISHPSPQPPSRSTPFVSARSGPVTTPRQRSRAASRVASPNLTPSRSSFPQRFSPLVDPGVESRPSQPGPLRGSPPRSPMPTSPPPQHTSLPPQASTVPQLATLRGPARSSLALPSLTRAIHPPVSSVPRAMTIQPELQSLPQRAAVPAPAPVPAPPAPTTTPAPAIRPLLARRSAGLAAIQVPTSSRPSPNLFSPHQERSRIPLRREEPLTSVPAPHASRDIVSMEENQTVSGETMAVGEGPSLAVGNGRVTVTVDNLSARSRRRGGRAQESGEVQVVRSARIRNMQAKREADMAGQGSAKKMRT